jgi:hypothetical protein
VRVTRPVAPCTRCRALVVYGERQCRSCGEAFGYGANAPSLPTADEIREALAAAAPARGAPATLPPRERPSTMPPQAAAPSTMPPQAAAPSTMPPQSAGYTRAELANMARAVDGGGERFAPPPVTIPPVSAAEALLDTGRFDDETARPVVTEDVPGLVDSALFAALTPDVVDVEVIADLETSRFEAVGDARPDPMVQLMLEDDRFDAASAQAVVVEAVPDLVDSTLFRAMTDRAPPAAETPDVERTAGAPRATKKASADDEGGRCRACGTPVSGAHCRACGTRVARE